MAHIKHICLFLLSKKNLVKNLWCDSLKFPPTKSFPPTSKSGEYFPPWTTFNVRMQWQCFEFKTTRSKLHKSEDTLFIKSINKCLYHIRETYKTRKTSDFFFCFVFVTTFCQIKCFSPPSHLAALSWFDAKKFDDVFGQQKNTTFRCLSTISFIIDEQKNVYKKYKIKKENITMRSMPPAICARIYVLKACAKMMWLLLRKR